MKVSFSRKSIFSPSLSIKSSIVYILVSLFLCFLPILVVIKTIQSRSEEKVENDIYQLRAIVQTGPKKRALPSQYLLQQMGISREINRNIYSLDMDYLKKRLTVHPVILDAMVDIIPPDTLYVDYSVRDPKAILGNWENTAVDSELTFFPLYPYYTPKSLPKVYLSDIVDMKWGDKSHSQELVLSLSFIKTWEDALYSRGISIKQVDVSHAYSKNLGDKEVVLLLEQVTSSAQFYIRVFSDETQNLSNFLAYFDANQDQFNQIDVIDMRLPGAAYIKYK